jgi:predicted 2-oxoglutarate/Fe(II)-dependent dioxygenase YbiX
MLSTIHAQGIYTADNVLTAEECAAWIARGAQEGFDAAPINQVNFVPSVRNNTRAMFDDVPAAEALWPRIKPLLPEQEKDGWRPCGVNERLRVYRYAPGEYFKWHADGRYRRTAHEHSRYTLMIYLNAPEDGGQTAFRLGFRRLTIDPAPGRVLLFHHRLLHAGTTVKAGEKYVLRSDIMYRRS